MLDINAEMNFCRRCGTRLTPQGGALYVCEQNHPIFLNASPAVGLLLVNDKHEVLILERAVDPGKGMLDAPGGFCDGPEDPLAAIARELQEETGLTPSDYSTPEFVLSGIDPYAYKGETLPVLGLIYQATVRGTPVLTPGDDAATANFVPIQDLDLDRVCFPSVRAGLVELKSRA